MSSSSQSTQGLAIGIDAGGTYTDAVLVERLTGRVLCQAKALTTPHDLSIGIAQALDALAIPDPQQVTRVSLATTLATNAIVEKRGGRVGLVLLGYDPKALAQFNLLGNLPVARRVVLKGRLDAEGREIEPLDEREVQSALEGMRGVVEALAVSGYFSVLQPAHEERVRALSATICAVPVVCGHELTSRLDAVKRAVTAALNARLLPIIRTLLDAVQACLHVRGITAPIWMMGGDGRLLPFEHVRARPVETILSGPAASVVAAQRVAGVSQAIVVDMGGTTSDIAVLHNGCPGVSPEGARVGGWPTHVNAVDVRTCGLGGDSYIRLVVGRLKVGPQRVIPVSLAATQWPTIREHLRRLDTLSQVRSEGFPGALADFVVQVRSAAGLPLNWQERAVLGILRESPAPIIDILERMDASHVHVQGIDQLEERGIVERIGLTPTDLLHAQGRYVEWDREAALLATGIVARQLGLGWEKLCEVVEEQMADSLAMEIMARLLKEQGIASETSGWDSYLLRRALDGEDPGAPVKCMLSLRDPIVGLGAPAAAFLPRLARKLHTEYLHPPHAEVGVALGVALGES